MHKKGFLFSLDAALAVLLSLFFITFLFYTLSQLDSSQLGDEELFSYSQSVATTMEVQNVYGSAADIHSFLGNYTKGSVCYNVTLYTATNVSLYSAVKSGCTDSSYPVTFYRTVIQANRSFSYALFRGWYT